MFTREGETARRAGGGWGLVGFFLSPFLYGKTARRTETRVLGFRCLSDGDLGPDRLAWWQPRRGAPAVGQRLDEEEAPAGLGVRGRVLGSGQLFAARVRDLDTKGAADHAERVTLQVMPTNSGAHPGLDGRVEVLKFDDGTAVGRADGVFQGRPVSDPRQLRVIELLYGTIRAQALPTRESLAFIEQLLGET